MIRRFFLLLLLKVHLWLEYINSFLTQIIILILVEFANHFLCINTKLVNEWLIGKCFTLSYRKKWKKILLCLWTVSCKNVTLPAKGLIFDTIFFPGEIQQKTLFRNKDLLDRETDDQGEANHALKWSSPNYKSLLNGIETPVDGPYVSQ